MRYLPKPAGSEAAECIRGFVQAQMGGRAAGIAWEELPFDYRKGFTRTPQLRPLLIREQKGLCAYTGVGLDERLMPRLPAAIYTFKPQIEHLKSQHQCRQELEAKGSVIGRDVGEDIAYENLVAALEVEGIESEHFGAVHRKNHPMPILPTDQRCISAFFYLESGEVIGRNSDAKETIKVLLLNHATPRGWRAGAIRAFAEKLNSMPKTELEKAVKELEDENAASLPEFAFVIAQIAKFRLAQLASISMPLR